MWQLRYRHNGHKIEESTKTGDERKARRLLRDRLRTAGTPDFLGPQAERVSWADLKAGILYDYTVTRKNRSTRRLGQSLAHLEAVFGTDKALAITDERVAQYIGDRLTEGAKPATVNRDLAALRRMFRLNKLVRRSCPDIRLLDESDNVREGFIEPADFEAFLTALRERGASDMADAAEFAYLSLWRRENVLGLVWPHVGFRRDAAGAILGAVIRLPHVNTKNKKPLTLVVGDQGRLLDLLRRRFARARDSCPYVFHCDGRRLRHFRVAWRTAAEAVGLPGLLFHDLRRSGARNLRRAGLPESVIMRMGGWKTRAMLLRYDITDESDLAAAASAYDAFLDTATARGRKVVGIAEAKRTGTMD